MTESRLATDEEKKWWMRFEKVLRAMPKSMEVITKQKMLEACPNGAERAAFDRDGHTDDVARVLLPGIRARVIANDSAI